MMELWFGPAFGILCSTFSLCHVSGNLLSKWNEWVSCSGVLLHLNNFENRGYDMCNIQVNVEKGSYILAIQKETRRWLVNRRHDPRGGWQMQVRV